MRKLTILLSTIVVAAALAACGGKPRDQVAPADAARLLTERNWLDVMPQNERDRLHVFRFTPKMGGGVYQDRTLFKGTFELFQFEADGATIRFQLPHTKEAVRATYTIRRVRDHAPFDLELTLDPSPRGPSRYYGFSDEKAAEADVAALLQARRI